jgi:hypothetical protein
MWNVDPGGLLVKRVGQKWFPLDHMSMNCEKLIPLYRELFMVARILFTIHSYKFIHTHSFITFAEFRVFSSLQAQVEGLRLGAEPRFELGADLQQPDMLPTEPCRTLFEPCPPY